MDVHAKLHEQHFRPCASQEIQPGVNGTELIKQLEPLNTPILAMGRKLPTAAGSHSQNVEFISGDFDDRESLARALAGVDRAFLTTNSSERVEEQQLRFVEVAKESVVRHVLYLSQLHADPNSPVRYLCYHAIVEKALAASGMSFTHLRPNFYMQAFLTGHAPRSFRSFLSDYRKAFSQDTSTPVG